jgi:phenylalanyl-tRNA synthetase alpha chain
VISFWTGNHRLPSPYFIGKNQIIDIFSNIGFNVSEGPEIEDDWHNFTALNLPEYPARDTFHTDWSRYFVAYAHVIGSGKVHGGNHLLEQFLQEEFAVSSRSPVFHQVEGRTSIKMSFADLKQTLYISLKRCLESQKIRLRPSYFHLRNQVLSRYILGFKTETDYRIPKEMVRNSWVAEILMFLKLRNPEEYNGLHWNGNRAYRYALYQIGYSHVLWEWCTFLEQFKASI